MRVLLDEQLCNVSADSVDQAIASAAALAQEKGRIIVEVMVDGRQWSHTTPESSASAQGSTSPAGEVRLTSADPAQLMNEVYADAASALSEADQLQRQAAELLQTGSTIDAMQKLNDAVSIWMSVQRAVSMGTQLQSSLNRTDIETVSQPTLAAAVDHLNGKLGEIRSALQRGDTVALADTLLYDLPNVVEQWRQLLKRGSGQ